MGTRVLRSGIVAVLLLAPACGGDDGNLVLPPSDTEPIRPSSIAVRAVDDSVADVLTQGVLAGFGPQGSMFVELLPPPATYGEFALAGVIVDDPNGTGRIEGRWYPPRIKRSDCATSIDSAPIPTVAASYVPGRPTEVFSGESIGITTDVVGAEEIVNITIQLFDEASQRDEMFAVVDEQYRTGFQVDCALGGMQDLVDAVPLDAIAGQPDSSVYEVEQIGFNGFVVLAPIGDRLLLQLGVGEGFGGAGGPTPDRSDLDEVAADQIARLETATLP